MHKVIWQIGCRVPRSNQFPVARFPFFLLPFIFDFSMCKRHKFAEIITLVYGWRSKWIVILSSYLLATRKTFSLRWETYAQTVHFYQLFNHSYRFKAKSRSNRPARERTLTFSIINCIHFSAGLNHCRIFNKIYFDILIISDSVALTHCLRLAIVCLICQLYCQFDAHHHLLFFLWCTFWMHAISSYIFRVCNAIGVCQKSIPERAIVGKKTPFSSAHNKNAKFIIHFIAMCLQ